MVRYVLFIFGLTFSFVISSCSSRLDLENHENIKQITSSEVQTGIRCNVEVYGDECNNLDNFTIVKKDEIKPEYIKSGSSIGGVVGTLTELEGQYSECSVDGETDCLTTNKYKALNISNHTSKIISSENIFGVSGNYIVPSSSGVLNGTSYGVEGSLVGTLARCSVNGSDCYLHSYVQGENSLKALNFDDLYSKRSRIKNGYELVSGIEGTQSTCSDGGSNCYIDGNTFSAAETSKLIENNIKSGVTLGLITGDFTGDSPDCSSIYHVGCVATGEYPSVPIGLTSSLLSSASIAGSNGEIEYCSTGESTCYINDSFKAVETERLIAANIKKDVVIGGVRGDYPSSIFPLVGATATTDLIDSNFNNLIVSSNSFEWFNSSGTRYTRSGDSTIIAKNIKNGVNIFGVVGSYVKSLPSNEMVRNDKAVVFKKKDDSLVCLGDNNYGGDCSSLSESLVDVAKVVSTSCGYASDGGAFAALKENGSVITWGNSYCGGNYTSSNDNYPYVSSANGSLTNVVDIFSNKGAFAALKSNGSVVTWGLTYYGGDFTVSNEYTSKAPDDSLSSGVTKIFSTEDAFAALKQDGSVVTWGNKDAGGDSSSPIGGSLSSGVVDIFSTDGEVGGSAFAALKSDGSVVTWGSSLCGGNSSSVQLDLTNVKNIFSGDGAFVALKEDGSVVVWGDSGSGGNPEYSYVHPSDSQYNVIAAPEDSLSSGIVKVFSTDGSDSNARGAFAALKNDGTVVTWGLSSYGGDSSSVQLKLTNVIDICSSSSDYQGGAFAALKSDGTVVTWGSATHGGDSSSVELELTDVVKIFSTRLSENAAFVALKSNGTVVAWGSSSTAGNISNVLEYTGSSTLSGIVKIFSAGNFFVGVREDDSYIVWGSY